MKPVRVPILLAALAAAFVIASPTVLADWDVTDPAKWVQLPDETTDGMDVKLFDWSAMPPIVLADDFLCTQTGPITDIHFWGSWREDLVPDPSLVGFHISIWSDIPTNEAIEFSRPGTMLWETNVVSPNYVVRPWATVFPGEWWFDPLEEIAIPEADTQIWQYNFVFDPETAFVQEGTPEQPVIYWVAIRATILEEEQLWAIGWKTSQQHWNDDAVYTLDPLQGWNELVYPPDHPKAGESIDLAFVITTTNAVEESFDFGDAPAVYPVLLANTGAYHAIVPGAPWFGDPVGSGGDIDNPDAEADGQPHPLAIGDDLNGSAPDDEDGILFSTPIAGQAMRIDMKAPIGGQIDAWIDMNADGDWSDAGEQVYSGVVGPGVVTIYPVLPFGLTGNTYARFRIASPANGPIPVDGGWPDGEVEDHVLVVAENAYDFGDAPIPGYPTTLALTGAYHVVLPGVYLGQTVDRELDGQPNGTSTGDDLAPGWLVNDEDGIILPPRLIIGAVQQFQAIASAPGHLSMWVDFNADGDWGDPGEALPPLPLAPGTNVLPIATPPTAVAGGVHCRFRYSVSSSVPREWGSWPDGEVEDYEIEITAADFGDAPDTPYPTTLAANGAWHAVPTTPKVYLGALVDTESDGQPTVAADGDDISALADEDGITVIASLIRGHTGVVQVISSTNANLFAWVDMNRNGSWDDAFDQVLAGTALTSGLNQVMIPVPLPAAIGPTYARFRVSTAGSLGVRGFAPDGEVEDYLVDILQATPGSDIVITNIKTFGSATGIVYWAWESNVTYQLQSTTNLLRPASPDWTNVGSLVDAPTHMQSDTDIARTVKLYRVTAPWTP